MSNSEDIARWSALAEGQFFERKSAFERPSARPRQFETLISPREQGTPVRL